MPHDFEHDLPQILRFNPGVIADPIPEWWIRELDGRVQLELVAIRLETLQAVLQAQAEGLGRAVEALRKQAG